MAENLDGLDVSSMSNSENAHVLVVDDNAVDLKLIECWLKSSSYKVTAVDSGLRALQFLGVSGLKVDMIITDYSMPDMNGYELLKKIKESPNFKEVPVVVMSSDNVWALINMCLNEGAVYFLSKPVKVSDIEMLSLYMKKGVGGVKESGINKRKLGESSGQPSSPPSILPQTASLSPPSPPLSSTSSFSAPSSGQPSSPPSILPQTASLSPPSPPLSSTSSFSAPSSGQPSSPPSILPQTASLSSPSPPLSSTSSFSAPSSGQPSSPPSILPQTASLSSPSPPLSSTSSFSAPSSPTLPDS